ncbi:MAG: sensor histidine kinase [Actinomycetota bacterium]
MARGEEDDLQLAHDLLMVAEAGKVLGERALHWGMRLVGASAGFLVDEQGAMLACQSVDEELVHELLGEMTGVDDVDIVPFGPDRYAIVIPIQSQRGTASLGVVSGAFTPLFGSDEVERLRHHAATIGVALERVHLTEQMRRLDEVRREFLANAAHELRSPLTTIVGISSTLSDHRGDLNIDKWSAGLDALNRQGQRMRMLINNLLDLTQMEQGRLKIEHQAVELEEAARASLETSPPPEDRIVDIAIEPGLKVIADPMRLDQIVTNLLTNAYRYGGRHIHIEAHNDPGGVVLTVADDGPGVPEELAPNVFDPFARGSDGGSKAEGSGLGLAIVRRLAEAFGGDVTYEAGRPQGARFLLHLRRAA